MTNISLIKAKFETEQATCQRVLANWDNRKPNHAEWRTLEGWGFAEKVTDSWSSGYILTESGREVVWAGLAIETAARALIKSAKVNGSDPLEMLRCPVDLEAALRLYNKDREPTCDDLKALRDRIRKLVPPKSAECEDCGQHSRRCDCASDRIGNRGATSHQE